MHRRAFGLLLTLLAMAAVGCRPTFYQRGADRKTVMAELRHKSPDEQIEALWVRIITDSRAASSDPGHRDFANMKENELASVEAWSGSISDLAGDYAVLGNAYFARGDSHAALGAYARALQVANGRMIDPVRKSRVRIAVFRGRQRVWQKKKDALRAKVAGLLVVAEERFLESPGADEADEQYGQLIRASNQAQNAIEAQEERRRAQRQASRMAALNAFNQGLQQVSSQAQNAGTATNSQMAGVNRQMQQSIQLAVRVTLTVVTLLDGGFENLTLQEIGPFLDVFPDLKQALSSKGVAEFLTTDAGRATAAQLRETLERVSAGDALGAAQAAAVAVGGDVGKAATKATPATKAVSGMVAKLEDIEIRHARGALRGAAYWRALYELGVSDQHLTQLKKLERQKDSLSKEVFAREKEKIMKLVRRGK